MSLTPMARFWAFRTNSTWRRMSGIWPAPADELTVFHTRFGRLGILIGRDALYPELARLLAIQGADLIVGIAASPGARPGQGHPLGPGPARRREPGLYRRLLYAGAKPPGQGQPRRVLGTVSADGPHLADGQRAMASWSRPAAVAPKASSPPTGHRGPVQPRQTSRFRPRQEMHLGSYGAGPGRHVRARG